MGIIMAMAGLTILLIGGLIAYDLIGERLDDKRYYNREQVKKWAD